VSGSFYFIRASLKSCIEPSASEALHAPGYRGAGVSAGLIAEGSE
jgi:hypothetical protein